MATIATIDPISVGVPTARIMGLATILSPDDFDLTAVSLTAGVRYSFIADGADHLGGTVVDPYIALWSGDQTRVLGFDEDTGFSFDPILEFTPSVSGVYIVEVGDINSIGKTYTLLVTPTTLSTPASDFIPGVDVLPFGNI